MDNRDFSNIGEQIRRSVEDAMHSMDFEQLNKHISDSVNYALDEARKNLSGAGGKENGADPASGEAAGSERDRAVEGSKKTYRAQEPAYKPFSSYKKESLRRTEPGVTAVRVNEPSRVPGILYTVFGGIGIGVSGVLLLVVLLIALVMKPLAGILAGSSIFLVALAGIFSVMLAVGNRKRGLIKRLHTYLAEAGNRMFCSVEELARAVGKPEAYVAKDLKKMIAGGILPEAHLDEQRTCLMLDHQTYHQYLEAHQGYQERQKLEEKQQKQKKEQTNIRMGSPEADAAGNPGNRDELQKMMAAGREYVRILREANDAIPGEAISFKLSKLEAVISRIFETIEKHPEQMKEMERFMDYYLPTTVKLVNAYRDFDSANIEGSNITSAKREIEQTLDTINQAFERLLDDLYQDTVLDVSTDASVLQTMLKSEGYTNSDFRRKDNE